MNIFVLDPNPVIAASYHCDQHLHKMILESAQMLSTAAQIWFPRLRLYKPAYENHPCTKWVRESTSNAMWVIKLAETLDGIRQSKGADRHKSMDVIETLKPFLADRVESFLTPHIFVGDPLIQIAHGTVFHKYQLYYRAKHHQWLLDKGHGMSYKDRPIPEFMKDII